MQSENSETKPIGTIFKVKLVSNRRPLSQRKKLSQRIDHYISDEVDNFPRAAFSKEMFDSVFLRDEEVVGQGVGKNAVDLFRHGTIKTAQAGFDVRDADAKFYGRQRGRDGRVDVTDNEHQVWLVLDKYWFDAFQDFGSLHRVGA